MSFGQYQQGTRLLPVSNMATNHELIVATEASGQLWSAAAWDLQTGSSVRTFKGQAITARCLCLQAGHTLIAAADHKPLLQLWSLSKKDETQQKIVCPGHLSALAVSPDGFFCVGSISEKIYIWEMTAGNLMGLLNNIDEASKIQFTDDGSHLVVGTCSGLLKIWNFANVLSTTGHRAREVFRTINAHSELITDIHVGCGGPAARVVTASLDGTCKLWDMLSGDLIRTVVFEDQVTAVIMDKQENYLIAGLNNGLILRCSLYEQTSQTEVFVSKDATKAGESVLQGHEAAVTCLALSSDSLRLASGSQDKSVKVWDLENVKNSSTIRLSDTVQNLLIIPSLAQTSTAKRHGPPVSFKLQVASNGDGKGTVFNVTISDTSQVPVPDFGRDIASMLGLCSTLEARKEDSEEAMDDSEKIQSLKREIAHLKQVNKDLYSRVTKEIVSQDKHQSIK